MVKIAGEGLNVLLVLGFIGVVGLLSYALYSVVDYLIFG